MKNKIVCIHLFNNYTGSPKILMQVIDALKIVGYEVDLITNKSEGFLSNISGIHYRYIFYQWKKNKLVTLFYFIFSQIQLFFIITKNYRQDNTILYINTITPIGAAIAGKLFKKKIIYHVHEKYIAANMLHKTCQFVYEKIPCYSIFVSKYLQESYPKKSKKSSIVYNTLEKTFKDISNDYLEKRTLKSNTILMVCSLRSFKGIYEFVELSKLLPLYNFELVLSAPENEVEIFKQGNFLIKNLSVFGSQINLHPFYQRAKLLLNLSDSNLWIETFGLTILEAMEYGIPSIVPKAGGPKELVSDCYNGYLINSKELNEIKEKIDCMMKDENLYDYFSKNAILKAKDFDNDKMASKIIGIIENM